MKAKIEFYETNKIDNITNFLYNNCIDGIPFDNLKIFKTIGKNIDGEIPSGNHWHSQLIKQMTESTQRFSTSLVALIFSD